MHRFLILGGLSVALISPLAVRADDDHHRERRYYDREHRDYHVWNDHEDRAYRVYLGERHQEYREWHRVDAAASGNTSGGAMNTRIIRFSRWRSDRHYL